MRNKLRKIFTIERLVWCLATMLLAAVFFIIGMTAPDFIEFGAGEKAQMSDVIDSQTTDSTVLTNSAVVSATTTTAEDTQVLTDKIHLNSATKEQLMSIPGIGDVFAQRILDYRDEHGGFKEISELMQIKGIGEARYRNWSPYFIVD